MAEKRVKNKIGDVIILKGRCYKHEYNSTRYYIRRKRWQIGKKDTITKEYMRNPIVFADAFNKYLSWQADDKAGKIKGTGYYRDCRSIREW